jgi:hypothetical protein
VLNHDTETITDTFEEDTEDEDEDTADEDEDAFNEYVLFKLRDRITLKTFVRQKQISRQIKEITMKLGELSDCDKNELMGKLKDLKNLLGQMPEDLNYLEYDTCQLDELLSMESKLDDKYNIGENLFREFYE